MKEYQRIYAVFKKDEVLHIDHTKGNCYKWIHNTFKDKLPKELAVHQVKTIQHNGIKQKASEVVPDYLEWQSKDIGDPKRTNVQQMYTRDRDRVKVRDKVSFKYRGKLRA